CTSCRAARKRCAGPRRRSASTKPGSRAASARPRSKNWWKCSPESTNERALRRGNQDMAGGAAGTNPIAVIDDNPMNLRQWIVVVLMILLNALDGFDVLSSAFAAPGISIEWGIPRSELGIVLSAELIGMGFGSVLLGS